MKRYLIYILLLATLLSIALAGPVIDKDLTYQISLPTLTTDNWRMSFISVGEFQKDGWNFSQFNISTQYIKHKQNCGQASTFAKIVYEMSAEERQHKGCVINGTYQEVYCFKPTTNKSECTSLAPYKINENYQLTFDAFYNSYMWDINRADIYKHFPALSCTIVNNSCTFTLKIKSAPYNPFIVVLERLNSTEVYFSNELQLDTSLFSDSAFACDDYACSVHKDINLTANVFYVNSENSLSINLTEQLNLIKPAPQIQSAQSSIWDKLIAYIQSFSNIFN